jgi:sugar/nucleoside kinase (ribokinase family)
MTALPPDSARSFVLVLGSVTLDRNELYGHTLAPALGGSGTAIARALSRLGMDVVWLTPAAESEHAELMQLAGDHLTVVPLPSRHTLCYRNIYPDRSKPMLRIQKVDAFPDPIAWDAVEPWAKRRPDLVIGGPLTPWDWPLALLQQAAECAGKPLWLDPQGYVRKIDTHGRVSPQAWTPKPDTCLQLIKLDWQEAHCMLGRPDHSAGAPPPLAELTHRLQVRYPNVTFAVTAGELGSALLESRSHTTLFQPAVPTPASIEPDPTGCGDIYLAGLVYARLHLGKDWAEAVRIATIAAGLNCQHQGVYAPSSNEIWGEMGRGFADG